MSNLYMNFLDIVRSVKLLPNKNQKIVGQPLYFTRSIKQATDKMQMFANPLRNVKLMEIVKEVIVSRFQEEILGFPRIITFANVTRKILLRKSRQLHPQMFANPLRNVKLIEIVKEVGVSSFQEEILGFRRIITFANVMIIT